MGSTCQQYRERKVEGVVMSIQKYDGHMYAAAGPNASPDVYHVMFQIEEEL